MIHHRTLGNDLLGTVHHTGAAALEQFATWDSLLLWGGSIGVTALLLATENSWQEDIENARLLGPTLLRAADLGGILLTQATVPVGAYIWGRAAENQKLTQFAVEATATQGLALLETLALSQLPIHSRPVVERGEISDADQAFFNRFFRGASSLPSGHITGSAVLMFKGWEWYGWSVGLPALLATVFIGYARIEEGQHYTSDIWSGVALAGLASLATTRTRSLWKQYLPPHLGIAPLTAAGHRGLVVSGRF